MQTLKSPTSTSASRIGYIDMMKGMTILWIMWYHTDYPDLGAYHNHIFFFLSGMFFKIEDAKIFFIKKIKMILIPFCFFYIMSIPFMCIDCIWHNGSFTNIEWHRIGEIFKIEAVHHYLSLNVPLWFLLTLFMIQIYAFVLFRLPGILIFSLAILSYVFYDFLYTIPTPFMINNGLAWFGVFAFGYLFGKPLHNYLDNSRKKTILFFLSLFLILGITYVMTNFEFNPFNLLEATRQFGFFVCSLSLFSLLGTFGNLPILSYFGKNSLIILGSHLWFLVPLEKAFHKFSGIDNAPLFGFLAVCLVAAVLIPLINWMNKNIPNLVGKKPQTTVNLA